MSSNTHTDTTPRISLRRLAFGLLAGTLLSGCSMHGEAFNTGLTTAAAPAPKYDTVLSPGVGNWPNLKNAEVLAADEACYSISTGLMAQQDDLSRKASYMARILSDSPTGSHLVQKAISSGVSICFTHLEDDQGYLDYDARRLYIDVTLGLPHSIAVAAHELAHMDQRQRGFLVSSDMDPRAAVFAAKVMEADAEALSTRVVYELEAKGYDFRSILHTEAFADYLPVYTAFRNAAAGAAPNGNLAVPMRAAFNSWTTDTQLAAAYEDTVLASVFPDHFKDDSPLSSGSAASQDGQSGGGGCFAPTYGQISLDEVVKDYARISSRAGQTDYLAATGGLASARKSFDRIHEPYSLSAIAKIRGDISRTPNCEATGQITLQLPAPQGRTL